jgi:membrane protein implicated in regulation of membrane protease activity
MAGDDAMKLRLGDLDPRNLSAKPFLCLLIGVGAFCISGWSLTMDVGPRWVWAVVVIAAFALIFAGIMAARREMRERDAAEDEEHA